MSLRSIDLNLIPTLQALLTERSVTRAAAALGLTQSATSSALGRLRETLNDPLLVRVGARMELTPKAVDLVGPLQALCDGAEAFFLNRTFDPSTERRTFVIATSDYATFLLAGPLLAALQVQAPRMSIRFVDINAALTDDMAARRIDLVLIPSFVLEDLAPAPLRFRKLVHDTSVAVFRRGHPLEVHERVKRSDLARYRLISFHPSSGMIEQKRARDFQGGSPFDAVAFVPQVTLPPFLLAGTDYFAILPARLSAAVADMMQLSSRPFDFVAQDVEMGLAWSPIQDADPAHRWFRTLIESAVQPAPTPTPTPAPTDLRRTRAA